MTRTLNFSKPLLVLGALSLAIGCGSSGGGADTGGSSSGGSSSGSGGASVAQSGASGGSSAGSRKTGGSSGLSSSSANGGSAGTSVVSASSSGQGGGGAGGTSRLGGGTAGAGGSELGGSGPGGTGAGGGGKGGGAGTQTTIAGGTSAAGGVNTTGGRGGNAGTTSSGGATATGGTTGSAGSTAVSCPATALAAGDSTHTLKSGGKDRTYVLHVPTGYTGSKAVPLLVDFHPHGSTGPNWRKDTPYLKLADADGVISAFPSAIGDWNVGPCCADGVDDVGFAKDMVKEIKGLACIDGKRVYAAGFSMGGGMTNYVACHAADVFAAFAPAAFALLQEVVPDCKPGRPITVVAHQGTADPYVPYAGGLSNLVKPINFLGAVAAMKKWAELSGCTGSAADMGNGCQGYAASQCQGEEVVLCTKQGGQHEAANANLTWPILKKHAMP